MVDPAAQKLAQLMNDTSKPEWKRSAQILSLAFTWNKNVLQQIQGSRSTLLMALSELANALTEGNAAFVNLETLIEKTTRQL